MKPCNDDVNESGSIKTTVCFTRSNQNRWNKSFHRNQSSCVIKLFVCKALCAYVLKAMVLL